MKKLMFFLLINLSACSDDSGKAFVGVWKNDGKSAQIITIAKAGEGYSVQATFIDPQWSSMNLDIKAKADGPKSLVTIDGRKRVLELNDKGEMTSHLYGTKDGSRELFTKTK